MKIIFIAVMLIISAFGFCGCGTSKQISDDSSQISVIKIEGLLKTKAGDDYLLQTSDEIVNINSTKISLDEYIGKNVEVKGMYSGSTLYVDEVK